MDEKELQKLYNAINGKFDIGDWNTFKGKMQDANSRKRFYDAIGQQGLDLGDYEEYEQRLSGVKKKEPSPLPPSAEPTPLPSQVPAVKTAIQQLKQTSIKEQFGGMYEGMPANKAVSTYVKPVRERDISDFEDKTAEKEARNKQVKALAVETTATRRLKAKKQPVNEKNLDKEKELLQKDIDEGKLILSADNSGNKIYARQPGVGESLVKGLKSSIDSVSDAATIAYTKATGSPEDLAAVYEMIGLRKKRDAEREFSALDLDPIVAATRSFTETTDLPTAAPGTLGGLAEFGSAIGTDVVLAAATGGAGATAKMSSILTKMYASSYGNKSYELYERRKQDLINRGVDERQASITAAQDATKDAATAAIPDAAINTLFFSGKLHSPAANNFVSVMKGAIKDAVKVGALGAAGSGVTSGIESAQGYDAGNIVEKMIDAGGEFAKLDLMFKVLPILRTLPKAVQSAVKEFAVDPVVKPIVADYLKKLPEGVDVMKDIEAYEEATKNLRGVVSEEKMASLGGRMQKRVNRINDINTIKEEIKQLEEKKKDLPDALHGEIDNSIKSKSEEIKSLQKEIGNIDKEIEQINKEKGTGLEREIDEATGQPIIEGEEISQPIELSTEIGELYPKEKENAGEPIQQVSKSTNAYGGTDTEVTGVVSTEKPISEKPQTETGVQPSAEPISEGTAERTPAVLGETKAEQPTVSGKEVGSGVGGDVMKAVNDKMRQTELEMEFKSGNDSELSFKNNDVEIVVAKPIGADGKYSVTVSEKSNSNTGFTLNEGKTKLFDTKLEALEYAKEQKEQSLPTQEVKAEQPTVSETPPALRDVESTAKALEVVDTKGKVPFSLDYLETDKRAIAEAYHKDKASGKETELTKAIESLLSKEQSTGAKKEELTIKNQEDLINSQYGKELEKQLPDTLSPTEKQGSLRGGEENAAATIITGEVHRASEKDKGKGTLVFRKLVKGREEKALEDYAKEAGIILPTPKGENIGGAEQLVYVSEDGKTVTKVNSNVDPDTSWNDLFHRIAIHNALFPDVAYTLKGFTKQDGNLAAVFEQPYIQEGGDVRFSEVKAEMKKMGFEPLFENPQDAEQKFSFINKETGVIVKDLHGENVIKGADGKIHFIDPIITLSPTRDIKAIEQPTTPERVQEEVIAETEQKPNVGEAEPPIGGEPPKLDADGNLMGSEDAIRGITIKANEERRKDWGMLEREKKPETFEQWDAEAEKMLAEGYDINKLIDKMENGEPVSPVENSIRKIYAATLDRLIAENPTDELLTQAKRYAEAEAIANSQAGKNLVSLKGNGTPRDTLADFYVAKMEALNVDKLSESQKQEVKVEFEKVKKEREEFKRLYEEAEAKLKEQLEINELLKLEKESKVGKAKKIFTNGKRDYVKERAEKKNELRKLIEEYKAAGKKMGIAADGGAESFEISVKMAKVIMDIVKTHVGEVGAKLDEVVKRTLNDVNETIDWITEKDIRDIIRGVYSEKKKTRDEIVSELRQIKTEQLLLDEYVSLVNKEFKEEKKNTRKEQRLKEIRGKVEALKKEQGVGKYSDEAKAKAIIERNKKKEVELKRKLAEGEFETKPKPKTIFESPEFKAKNPDLYNKVLDSYNSMQEAQLEFEKGLLKNEMDNAGLGGKIALGLRKTRGTIKAFYAGVDMSAALVQNAFMFFRNPVIWGKAFMMSLKDFASEKRFDRYLADLHNSPDWNVIKGSGLRVSEPKSLLEEGREEAFPDRWKAVVKFKGKEFGNINIGGKKYELFDLLKPFERAFTSMSNANRVIAFRTGAEQLYRKGYTFEKNPEKFQKLAKRLNNATGAGDINEGLKKVPTIANSLIWSTRLMAAKLNILGISDAFALATFGKMGTKGYYKSLGEKGKILSEEQKQAVADLAKFATAVMGLSYSISLASGGTLQYDPQEDDFLDIELPNGKRVNITGGFSSYIAKLTQIIRGGKKDKLGVYKSFEGDKSRGSETMKFLRGKMPPLSASMVNLAVGKDFMGQETDFLNEAERYKMPLAIGQIAEQIKNDGALSIFYEGVPTFLGVNIRPASKYSYKFDKEVEKYIEDNQLEIPYPSRRVTDNQGARKMNDDEYAMYTKRVSERIENDLKQIKEKGLASKRTDPESIKEAVKEIIKDAFEISKMEVFDAQEHPPKEKEFIENYEILPFEPKKAINFDDF